MKTLIFHFLIIWAKRMLHIVEWNGTMLHSGMKWSCFIWKGVLWSTLCLARLRRVKHTKVWSAAYAAWSGTACHEAKPFQASCFFCPEFGQKKWGGRPDLNRRPPGPQPGALTNWATTTILIGTPARTRTVDPVIKSHLLYRLSYERTKLWTSI